jgi:toxin ParE1/3/4
MLLDDFNEIASNPDLGKNYSEITEDLFGFKAGRYIIFYRTIKESEIEIIGILHEEMDLNNRVKEK